MDIAKLCRSCMKEVASWEVGNFNQRAVDMFIFCTHIEVTNEDKLPKQFCYDCTIKVESAYTFIKKSQEVNITLKNLLSRSVTSVIVEPDSLNKSFTEVPAFNDHLYNTLAENSFYNNIDANNSSNELTASYNVEMQEKTYYTNHEDLNQMNSNYENEKVCNVQEKCFIEKDHVEENYMNVERESISCNNEHIIEVNKTCPICQKVFDSEIWYVNHIRNCQKENIIFTNKIQHVEKDNVNLVHNTTDEPYNNNLGDNPEIIPYNVESRRQMVNSNENFNPTPDITELLEQNVTEKVNEPNNTVVGIKINTEKPKDENKRMTCPVCQKAFVLEGWLQKHMLKKHNTTSDSHNTTSDSKENNSMLKSDKKEIADVEYKELKKCPLCETEFSSKYWFTKHLETEHSDTKVYMCSVCYSAFLTHEELQTHPCSERRFPCPTCGKRFRKRKQLTAHAAAHRTNRPYACNQCDKRFKVKSVLVGHLKLHEGTRPYLCHVCGDSFRVSSTLECHLRVHTGRRPHACARCGYRAHAASALRAHLRRHARARTYVCRHCAAAFVDRATLVRHERIHTGARPYRCAECGARYPDTWKCKLHMMRTHGFQLHQIPRITMDNT